MHALRCTRKMAPSRTVVNLPSLGARRRRTPSLGVGSFVEARYHRTTRGGSGVHYFPLTRGLTFQGRAGTHHSGDDAE